MPVTILLKAIGMTPEAILAHFSDFDNFEIHNEGGMLEFVAERWKGEVAHFDITDRSGKVIVEKDKRINAKHLRDLEAAKVELVSVPEDFLLGRVLTTGVVNPETGAHLATAHAQLTETTLDHTRAATNRNRPQHTKRARQTK